MLQFKPAIYRIFCYTKDPNKPWTAFDLLTVDGFDPNDTVYFCEKGIRKLPDDLSNQLVRRIHAGQWDKIPFSHSEHRISDFDLSALSQAPTSYNLIRQTIDDLINPKKIDL